MRPLYIVTERFDPRRGADWESYVRWSGLAQLTELVTLDSSLCPPVVHDLLPEDWEHNVQEDFLLNYFVDLPYLVRRVGSLRDRNLLCVFKNPDAHPGAPPASGHDFQFEGYDLVEADGGISALTNCGGFPKAFANAELSAAGLLPTFERAAEVSRALRREYPDEPHARCDLWAIYRSRETTIALFNRPT